jgi:hypothetical protein
MDTCAVRKQHLVKQSDNAPAARMVLRELASPAQTNGDHVQMQPRFQLAIEQLQLKKFVQTKATNVPWRNSSSNIHR